MLMEEREKQQKEGPTPYPRQHGPVGFISVRSPDRHSVAIRDTSLGIGPILLGRIFDYVLQPSLSLVTRHVLTYTSCIYTCLSTP
jgi:hypothetical protein